MKLYCFTESMDLKKNASSITVIKTDLSSTEIFHSE